MAIKLPCAIFDLDGCLAITPSGHINWDDIDFCTKIMEEAQPNFPIAHLFWLLQGQLELLVMTGRPERYRYVTANWMLRHKLPMCDLWMRSDSDPRSDAEVKRSHLNQIRKRFDVQFVVEDRVSVVKMWRDEGITCFQCAEGNY